MDTTAIILIKALITTLPTAMLVRDAITRGEISRGAKGKAPLPTWLIIVMAIFMVISLFPVGIVGLVVAGIMYVRNWPPKEDRK